MFSQECVKNSVHKGYVHGEGGCVVRGACVAGDGHCSGRYASYQNTFLSILITF